MIASGAEKPTDRDEDRPEASGGHPRKIRRLGRAAAVALLGAVLLVAAAGLLLHRSLPDSTELAELRESWPPTTAYMELRQESARQEGRELAIRYEPVPLERVPDALVRAVLVSEDAGFHWHDGIDWHELREAVETAWRRREAPRGASTLTMQLARNLYLSPRRNVWRKAREVAIARRLESELDKDRILELYLNVVELGPGIFGVEAASRHYFHRPVSEIDEVEASLLAATIPSPLRHNPASDTRTFRWRTSLIRERAFGPEVGEADDAREPLDLPELELPELEPPEMELPEPEPREPDSPGVEPRETGRGR